MAFRLVSSAGDTVEPAVINLYASGVVKPGSVVEFSRTGGTGVTPASSTSTGTNIFGICLDYAQGASDVKVRVVKIGPHQIWEGDCVNAASTAQIGLRHVLDDHLNLRNTAVDLGAGNTNTAVFRAIDMVGATTGSGRLLGYFRAHETPLPSSMTTFL